ncbi:MAG: hypothetical protein IJI41_03175 [Anaerolineaceae bacterium]|nr:hypothetical protein [Anaerolineaceae bacterium]
MKICQNCKFSNIDEWDYCVICGKKLLMIEPSPARNKSKTKYATRIFIGAIILILIYSFLLFPKNLPIEHKPMNQTTNLNNKYINTSDYKDNKLPDQLDIGDIFYFGKYEQDNDFSNGKEPIEWIVLSKNSGLMLVISKYGLDTKTYNNTFTDLTWETCTLRTWLNEEFINTVFTSDEKTMIWPITLNNPNNPEYGTNGGNKTEDRVFLLSIEEIIKYLPTTEERSCQVTPYAKSNGATVIYQNNDPTNFTIWLLRSPGHSPYYAACVMSTQDHFSKNCELDVHEHGGSIRPAMWLKTSSNVDGNEMTANDYNSTKNSWTITPKINNPTSLNDSIKSELVFPNDNIIVTETIQNYSYIKIGDTITFGSYEQDGNKNNGTEGIEWIVLSLNNGKALLLSKYGLDSRKYNDEYGNLTWEKCSLRSWLNNDFYSTAFTETEQDRISNTYTNTPSTTHVRQEDNYFYTVSGGNPTYDRIFLLSIDEVNSFFPNNPNDRLCYVTNYSKLQNVAASDLGTSWWWLRSPGFWGTHAAFVGATGYLEPDGWEVNYEQGAVRPAFWLIQ